MILAMFLLVAPAGDPPPVTVVEKTVLETMLPAGSPGSWIRTEDYPLAAMRDGREGVTGVLLEVGPDGLPRRCEITASSGHADLDATSCRLLMERARFQVRRDAKGVRVGGVFTNRVRWQIPEDYAERLAAAGFHLDEARAMWPRGPIPDPDMVTLDPADHYPRAALAARQEGDVRMTLAVDAAGKVTGCTVVDGSLVPALDNAACALMRSHGAFQPALDSAGKPVRSTVPATFSWLLPHQTVEVQTGKSSAPVRKFPWADAGSATMSVVVGADGVARDCSFSSSGKFADSSGQTPCDMIGGTLRYIPFVDANGQPVAQRVTMRTELTIEDAGPAKGAAGGQRP